MAIKDIYRGMQNGAETIHENFTDLAGRTTAVRVNLAVGGGNTGTALLYKEGKVVTIYFVNLNGKGSGGNGSTILTIPTGYRTPASFEVLAGSTDRSTLNSASLTIAADGTINWQRNTSYGSDYMFAVTYTMA